MRRSYASVLPKARPYPGFQIAEEEGFGGLVTAQSYQLPNSAQALQNLRRETSSLMVRKGYRNVIRPQTNQTVNRGLHWCEAYVSGVHCEGLVSFDLVSGSIVAHEQYLDSATDSWQKILMLNAGVQPVLNGNHWRSVCFLGKAYFFNADDTVGVYQYDLQAYGAKATPNNSFIPYNPPSDPLAPPTVKYWLNSAATSYAYDQWGPGSGSGGTAWAFADVTVTGVASKASAGTGYVAPVLSLGVTGPGAGSFTIVLKHATTIDASYNDPYVVTVQIPTASVASLNIDWENIQVTANGAGSQLLVTRIAGKVLNSSGQVTAVTLYSEFLGKTRTSWATLSSLTYAFTAIASGANELIIVSPITLGGMLVWGTVEENNIRGLELAYTYYNSTASVQLESGLTSPLTLDATKLRGPGLNNDPKFPMGTVPLLTTVASLDVAVDKVRIYARQVLKNPVDGRHVTAWRRVVEQNDATTTYNLALTPEAFADLTAYTPATFDKTNLVAACVWGNRVVGLYRGQTKNVRISRNGVPWAHASVNDATDTPVNVDDPLRGVNFTLAVHFLDEPMGAVAFDDALVIVGKRRMYVVYDTMQGRAEGFTPPQVIGNAPGCANYEAFCKFHDAVVYVTSDEEQAWAVRVPRRYIGTVPEGSDFEFGYLLRGGLRQFLYGGSPEPNHASINAFVNTEDDSLHLRFNQNEVKLTRPDKDGDRHWEPHFYTLGQWGGQWHKAAAFESDLAGKCMFVVRHNGAVDEFERTHPLDPATSAHFPLDLVGQGFVPASTDTGTDRVTVALPQGLGDGSPVTVSADGGGLFANTTYYLHWRTYVTYSFHVSQAEGQSGANSVNLTANITQTVTPLGRDDGDAIGSDIYFQSKIRVGPRRRPKRVHVQKTDLTDSFTVTAYDESGGSSVATVPSGRLNGAFQAGEVQGHALSYRIDFEESGSEVLAMSVEEEPTSPRRGG